MAMNTASSLDLLHQAQLSEVAVAVCFNGISQSVMMVSPNNLHDFALGFALTEGLINSTAEVLDIVIEKQALGWQLDLHVLSRTEHRLKQDAELWLALRVVASVVSHQLMRQYQCQLKHSIALLYLTLISLLTPVTRYQKFKKIIRV